MTKKYELTDERSPAGLYRIRALRDIPSHSVKAGDLGGWIESEYNLSQEGDCWVADDAQVYGKAWVSDSARASGHARVYGHARAHGDAQVAAHARVCGGARVHGDAEVCGEAWVYGDARVYGRAWLYSNARVYGRARVYDDARITGDAQVYGMAWVHGNARVFQQARVLGDAEVHSHAQVGARSEVFASRHVIVAGIVASSWFDATITRQASGPPHIVAGCYAGALPGFKAMIESDTWIDADAETRDLCRPVILAQVAAWELHAETFWKEGA